MAENKPPRSTNTMAPWEGIDVGFSPRNVAGAVFGGGTPKAPVAGSPRQSGAYNPTSTASSAGGSSTRPASTPVTSSAGPSGMMQAMSSPGSIIQRSISQSLAQRTPRRTGWTGAANTGMQSLAGATGRRAASTGLQSAGGAGLSASTGTQSAAGAGVGANWTNNVRLKMPTMTAGRQQAIDRNASRQTAGQKREDPHNWAGIARDLGNAGDARYAQYKTGAPASSNAQRLVGTQKAAAKAEQTRGRSRQEASRATAKAKPKRGGRGNRAV